jgi:hypothetical protein
VNYRLKEALRRKIDGHNRLVLLSTIGGALGVVLMWVMIYFVANWLPLFFLTIFKGLEAEAPRNLTRIIILGMMAWMVIGWIDRHLCTADTGMGEISPAALAFKILLLPPRATFGVWDNLHNRIGLNEPELDEASSFIEHLYHTGKIQLQAVPVELPDDSTRDKILTTLRSTELIRKFEFNKTDFLALTHPERVAAFV